MEPMVQAAVNWQTPQPIVETLTFEDERVNRYLWYPGEDLPWPEIKGGWIKRCRVTPILPFLIWERINDVPEDMRKAVRKDWHDRTHQEAQYEIRPQGIFDSIMGQYQIWGVRELMALQGMHPQEVASRFIDMRFCPWPDNGIPKPYRMIEAQIQETMRGLNGDRVLISVGEDMLQSIVAAKAYDEMLVDEEESRKELKYSRPGLRALSRLERRRRDAALNDMAAAQNKVFDKVPEILAAQGGNNDATLMAMLQAQQEANALLREELVMNREALNALLTGKRTAKPSRTRKPAPANAE